METTNNQNQYELFNDLPRSSNLQAGLYVEKVPGGSTESVGLYEFIHRIRDKYNIENEEKQLDVTLDYLYPLLKEGKIILRIANYKVLRTINDVKKEIKFENDKQKKEDLQGTIKLFTDSNVNFKSYIQNGITDYKKEEVNQAIKDIKDKWLTIIYPDERNNFEEFGVQFKLPKGKFIY